MYLYWFPSRKAFFTALHTLQNKLHTELRHSSEAYISFRSADAEETCLENNGEKLRVLDYQALLQTQWND